MPLRRRRRESLLDPVLRMCLLGVHISTVHDYVDRFLNSLQPFTGEDRHGEHTEVMVCSMDYC